MAVIRRALVAGTAAGAALVLTAGPSLAHECVNISKQNQAAGVQVVFTEGQDEPVWISQGVQKRIAAGVIDPATGEGFHGLIGFDFDGDNVADLSTYIVGPEDELPDAAQWGGATCRGIINIETLFTVCLGGLS
jgi:hypothetical protein